MGHKSLEKNVLFLLLLVMGGFVRFGHLNFKLFLSLFSTFYCRDSKFIAIIRTFVWVGRNN